MKIHQIAAIVAATSIGSTAMAAGPLDGISKQLDRNGTFKEAPYGVVSKPEGEPGNISITPSAIGSDSGRGGEFASEKSVVTTTFDTGGESGTRVEPRYAD